MTKEKIQKKYFELQLLSQQMQQIKQQLQMLDNQILELNYLKQSVNELKNVKKGIEILAPIGAGIFFKADLKDNENLIVNVGSNITVEKTTEQAVDLINEQIEEIQKIKKENLNSFQKLGLDALKIEGEINKLSKNV